MAKKQAPNWRRGFKLISSEDGHEIQIGDKVKDFRGDEHIVTDFMAPLHSASTGRVVLKSVEDGWQHPFFPSVINAGIAKED